MSLTGVAVKVVNNIDREINLTSLINRIESEIFATACVIQPVGDNMIYLLCDNANHGVILEINHIEPLTEEWAIKCLKDSIKT
jgi:hypothetical protein